MFTNKKIRRLVAVLQVIFGLAIVCLVIWQMAPGARTHLLKNCRIAITSPGWFTGALACMGLSLFITAWRWQLIARTTSSEISLKDAYAITLSGHLFNLTLPGATGGDMVRAAYAVKKTTTLRTETASSVLLDRIIGLLSIVLLTNVMVLIRLDLMLSHPLLKSVAIAFFLILLGGIVATVLLFGVNHLDRHPRLRAFLQRSRLGRIVARAYGALQIASCNPRIVFNTLVLSIVCQLSQVSCAWCLGRAIGIPLSWPGFATALPVINTAAIIPIAPGGLGLREAVTQTIFSAMQVPAEQSVGMSLMFYVCMLIWCIPGIFAFAWLTLSGKAPQEQTAP